MAPPLPERIRAGREFLKANWELLQDVTSDQAMGVPVPTPQKEWPPDATTVPLTPPASMQVGTDDLRSTIAGRRSRRKYAPGAVALEELSFLLWATQGVKRVTPTNTMRTVPSAGARHALETYLAVERVEGVAPGLYRYAPIQHILLSLPTQPEFLKRVDEALFGQRWSSAVVFIWSAVPYRTEWRYTLASHKLIALDAGHVCQNLYLACESLGFGTCAIGAYDQRKLDAAIGVDGDNEFAVYAAPVGRV